MEQLQAQLASLIQPVLQTARWYHAATLSERIASTADGILSLASPSHQEGSLEQAHKKLQRWKDQSPFRTGEFFTQRLHMDGITEEDALALLAEPIENVQARLSQPHPPTWVLQLTSALSESHAEAGENLLLLESENNSHAALFLKPFLPLLQQGIARLQAGVEELVQQYETLPFDPQSILSLLFPNVVRQIEPKVARTLVLELNIERLRGHLQGETSEERFRSYLERLSQKEHLTAFLEEYCVLARQLLTTVDLWVNCSLELLQRLCTDWTEILALFSPQSNPGVLVEATGGAGDTHRNGHSVMILRFSSGFQLVYKPKSLTIDIHFQEVLTWLNGLSSHFSFPSFQTIKVSDHQTYGWTECVVAAECTSEEEVRRFYERQGGYLALLYALDAADFHAENVLAAGEHPILIDLEALFHPHFQSAENPGNTRAASQAVEQSVLRIALLPQRFWLSEEYEGVDISGLGSTAGQLSPQPLPRWEGTGTDEMRLVRERLMMQGSKNRPGLNGAEVEAADYIEHIVKGFTCIYNLLMKHHQEFLNQLLPRFAHDEIRFVARATRTYALLLTESFHPNMLRDSLKRERFLDSLWIAVEQQPHLARLIPAERADLLRGDIPMFTTSVDSRDLVTSQGECIKDFFDTPSLDRVRDRIQHLNEHDMNRQVWMIRASFTTRASQVSSPVTEPQSLSHTHSPVSRERLVSAAQAIGDRLCEQALLHEDTADWFGLTLVKEREWLVAPAGTDLASGLPGIILFLSYLGAVTNNSRYTALAQSAYRTLRQAMIEQKAYAMQSSIGAFTGLSSCIYLYSHLAHLWDDSSFLQEAEELVRLVPERIERDTRFDLVDGSAGAIATLLSLYAVAPSPRTLTTAVMCGDHLLAHAQRMEQGVTWKLLHCEMPRTGFARGLTGIAWSLFMLAHASGEERFRETALAALASERSVFSCQQQSDTVEQADTQEHGMSWCYGAPGIALGRLASLPYHDNTLIRQEIEQALRVTVSEGFGYHHEQIGPNHSLYLGDFGNLETVFVAACTRGTEHYREHLERITAQILANSNAHGWVMGVPLNVETPGFMQGLAGIGYALLRLAEPERMPSVLLLQPPVKSAI